MAIRIADITDYLLKKRKYVEFFFIIFYLVGIVGIVTPFSHHLFVKLFPLALVLSFIAILFFHQASFDSKTIIVLVLIGLMSYLIEVAGVYTHLIFGNYKYGEALGIKLLDTPLLIAVNWVMLTYAGSSVTEKTSLSPSLKIILASFIILGYDIILEQIAPVVDMWYWENNTIPVRNYIAWFIIALAFQTIIRIFGIKIRNSIAWKILLIQAVYLLLLIVFFKLLR
jgi:putative membrane protein